MSILIGFLTFILVLIAAFVILLVLVQLPKKETGGGMAFGAGVGEMILGAGSGNVLTRITKYSVAAFLGLSLVLSILVSGQARKKGLGVTQAIDVQARSSATAPKTPATTPSPAPANSGLQSLVSTGAAAAASSTPLVTTTVVVNPTAPAAATNKPAGK